MKTGKTKYWIDTWASSEHIEAHLRWETLLLASNYQEQHQFVRHTPDYLFNAIGRFYDSIGIGLLLLPRAWEFWYVEAVQRICISFWLFSVWIDLPRKPLFKGPIFLWQQLRSFYWRCSFWWERLGAWVFSVPRSIHLCLTTLKSKANHNPSKAYRQMNEESTYKK